MNAGGIKTQLGFQFVAVAAALAGFIWAGNQAVFYLAPAHPDSLAALIGAAATIFAGYLAWEIDIFQRPPGTGRKKRPGLGSEKRIWSSPLRNRFTQRRR